MSNDPDCNSPVVVGKINAACQPANRSRRAFQFPRSSFSEVAMTQSLGTVLAAAFLVWDMPLAAAEIAAPEGAGIVGRAARLEQLFTRTAPIQGGLTEGPA